MQPKYFFKPSSAAEKGQLYVITPQGETLVTDSSQSNFSKIVALWKDLKVNPSASQEHWQPLYDAMAPINVITKAFSNVHEDVAIKNSILYYKDKPVNGALARNIISKFQAGVDVSSLINFLIKLENNPSMKSRNSLYNFLKQGNLPITDEGNVLGYKSVDWNYHSHTASFITGEHVDNSLGKEIPRLEWRNVDDDSNVECSYGYHIGTWKYATTFNYNEGTARLLISEFSPADVVSVPHEGEGSKIRVTYYKNIGETTLSKGPLPAPMYKSNSDPTVETANTAQPLKEQPLKEQTLEELFDHYEISAYLWGYLKELLPQIELDVENFKYILDKNDNNPERFSQIITLLEEYFDTVDAAVFALGDMELIDTIKEGKLKRALRIMTEELR